MPIALSYLSIVLTVAVVDFLWIGVLAKDLYRKGLSPYLAEHFVLWSAALFYVIYAGGIYYFCIQPSSTLLEAVTRGALLGFVAYCLYYLTNIAIIANWPVGLGFLDILWGTILTAIGAGVGFAVLEFFNK